MRAIRKLDYSRALLCLLASLEIGSALPATAESDCGFSGEKVLLQIRSIVSDHVKKFGKTNLEELENKLQVHVSPEYFEENAKTDSPFDPCGRFDVISCLEPYKSVYSDTKKIDVSGIGYLAGCEVLSEGPGYFTSFLFLRQDGAWKLATLRTLATDFPFDRAATERLCWTIDEQPT